MLHCKNIDLLLHCHVATARLAILTFASREQAKLILTQFKQRGVHTPLIVRCQNLSDMKELKKMGAHHVFSDLHELAKVLAFSVLTEVGVEASKAREQILNTPVQDASLRGT